MALTNFVRYFAISALLFTCIFCAQPIAQSTETDREALISFKSQIIVETPDPLSSWNQNTSPCNWTGVVCNRFRRVVELNLSNLRLRGSVGPHIGNLSFLRSIQLQNNQLSGTLPNELGRLSRLRVLNMSSNMIEGIIPRNISRCKELRVLDLMQNAISGGIPDEVSQLTQLQNLNLAKNHLSGSIPPSISNLSSLLVLNLGTNTLGGAIPSELARLRNLTTLDLTINNLIGTIPPSIYNISSLVHFKLASNNLWGELPSDIGLTLPNLLDFIICFNKFTGIIPWSLHNLTKIQTIRIAHNHIHGTIPAGLGNLHDLEMYNIGYNSIFNSGDNGLDFLESLTNSTRLNHLDFNFNLLEGVIPSTIGNLSKVLTKLYMGGNPIRGSIPSLVGQLSGLKLLDLSYCNVSGEIPAEIGSLTGMRILGLAGNHLVGRIPDSLGNLIELNEIDLSQNELWGRIPITFQNFNKLLYMDLSKNKLNGSIPGEILNLPSLSSFLNLSHNLLSGPLPAEVGQMESVVTISISDNLISGSIPIQIANCKSLEHLSLARNRLSGSIPNTLGSMRGLETLDLSSNDLSGAVPVDLQSLQVIQLLNLSYNNLEGEVPRRGAFADPSRVFLEGNENVCYNSVCKNSERTNKKRIFTIYIPATIAVVLVVCFAVSLLFCSKRGSLKIRAVSESIRGQHRMISYEELRVATEKFSVENLIGSGSFASVYAGNLRDGVSVAVKVFDMRTRGSWKSFSAECAALRQVRHRNLIKLITTCSSLDFKNGEFLALVYEYMSNGSLADWITGKRRGEIGEGLNLASRLDVAIDVATAVNYLHHECEAPVVHCDLKPSNILLDSDMTAKVGDFGISRLLFDQPSLSSAHALKGSIGYIPPEYGLGEKPTTAGDVYSFGIMLLELFTGRSPTDESFNGSMGLKEWVERALPDNLEQVLDPELLLQKELQCQRDQLAKAHDCLITVMDMALSCACDTREKRLGIRDALHKLKNVKETMLKTN